MEFIKRHYEKLILLALSIIVVFAVWWMSDKMEDAKKVKDSDLKIDIPAEREVSLKQKEKDYHTRKAELEKDIAKTSSDLTEAEAKARKSKDEKLRQEADQLREKLKGLKENAKELENNKGDDLKNYMSSKEFDPRTMIEQTRLAWNRTTPKSESRQNYHSDLVDIFKMAECPYCHYGVPYYCFTTSHKCLICGGELKSPPAKIKKRRKPTPDDLDGDGINNDNELRYGLNPKDPSDALLDADGDGFSNLYEINVSNTDPRNPTSCPPLWRRLRFKTMAKIKLPIQISSIDTAGNNSDHKTWEASIKLEYRDPRTGKLRKREQDCKIGDTLLFDGRKYKLTSLDRQFEKDDNGIERKKDIVTLQMIAENESEKSQEHELKLVFGQPVYSSDLRVVLEDVGVPSESDGMRYYAIRGGRQEAIFELRKGEVFEMGGVADKGSARNVPKVTYVLVDFDEKAKVAQLALARNKSSANSEGGQERDEQGVLMEVTADSYIVEDEWVFIPSDRTEEVKSQR